MQSYRQAPIRNPIKPDTVSGEEKLFKQGYEIGLTGRPMVRELRAVFNSPIMQGHRAGIKEKRLRALLLRQR